MVELWKDIEGYEGRYQVSNLGNVKSLRYGGRYEVRNLVPKVNNKGYEWVELWKDRKRSCRQIHRLVATAFIPNPDPECYTIINHKDENPRNNRVDNLEWCDYKYNANYYIERHKEAFYESINKAWRSSVKTRPRKRKCWILGPTKRKSHVLQVDKNGVVVKLWDSVSQITREENKSQWSITQCCEGKRKTAYGYKWHFVDAI